MNHSPSPTTRVLLLTSPGLYGAMTINRLARTDGIELVGVGLTSRIYRNKGTLASVRTMIARTGWRYTFSEIILASAIAWIRLRLTGRPSGLRTVGNNVKYLKNVNDAESCRWIESLAPDYVASFFFNQWIGANVRAIPRHGCVNTHSSLLPALRGPNPIFRTIERGLTKSGLTIHSVADDFDAGEILYQQTCEIPKGLSVMKMYQHQVETGAEVLAEWLAGRIANKTVSEITGNDDGVVDDYTTFPTADEVRQFHQAGHRLGGIRELHHALATID